MVYIVLRDVGRGVNIKACGDGDVSSYDNCLTGLVYLMATCLDHTSMLYLVGAFHLRVVFCRMERVVFGTCWRAA